MQKDIKMKFRLTCQPGTLRYALLTLGDVSFLYLL